MKYYYDLHCHTTASSDAPAKLESIVKMAKKRGLDGIAVTDHNKVYKGPRKIDGLDIIPGAEVDVKGGVHLLAYFIKKDIERNKEFKEAVKEIHRQGGFAVWAHPFRKEGVFKENEDSLRYIDGLESGNAMDDKEKREQAAKISKERKLFQTAGSDCHIEGQVGTAVAVTSGKINRENFKEILSSSEILIREEISDFRKRNHQWKKIMNKFTGKIKTDERYFLKMIFCRIVLRNYLRLSNLYLKKIDFNYKDEKVSEKERGFRL